MAKRRCISVDFYDSEEFCELPVRVKHLYTELILHSDDEGVVINPKAVLRICKSDKKVLNFLVEHNFLLEIDGVYVIRHWYIHNSIQPSKKVGSIYKKQLSKLLVSEDKIYEFKGDFFPEFVRPNITKLNLTKDKLTELNSTKPKAMEENIEHIPKPNFLKKGREEFSGISGMHSLSSGEESLKK